MCKVSVIIPVYNADKYLSKCLDSILNQTFKDIEVICVNDGSTDNSKNILMKYEQSDNRIKIINQENKGQSKSRNSGLEIAKGEYCYFVDSDDWIETNTIEKLVDIFKTNDVDVVIHSMENIVEEESCYKIAQDLQNFIDSIDKPNGIYKVPIEINQKLLTTPVNKLYKMNIIKKYNCHFPEGLINEDEFFIWDYLLHCKNFYYLNEKLYKYLRHSKSTMSLRNDSQRILDILDIQKEIYKIVKKYKNIEEYHDYLTRNYIFNFENVWNQMKKQYRSLALKKINEYYHGINSDIRILKLYRKYKYKKLNQFLNGIFSIKISDNRKHKIIKIFGIKLKFKINTQKIVKKRYKKILKNLRQEVNYRKIRVCFLVSETAKWNAQSLYDKMKNSNIFEPFVVVTNLRYLVGRPSYSHLLEYFKSCVSCVEIGWDENTKQGIDLKTFNPDIVFYQQPWDLYDNQNVEYVSNFALTYHFSYAMSDAVSCIEAHYHDFYSILHKYFVFSDAEKEEYKNKIKDNCKNVLVLGHPKLDIYKDYDEHNYESKYVIYAPHHSLEENSLNFATFRWNGEYILNWAKQHHEFDWVFKPHPRLKQSLIFNSIMSEEEVENYYSEWAKIGLYYNDGNYFDLFKNSKCLITDCGSFLIEYLPTCKPVIHLRNPKGIDYIPACKVAMESYYKAWNIDNLNKYLDEILIKNNDYMKNVRIETQKKLKLKQFNSSEKIIKVIKNELINRRFII